MYKEQIDDKHDTGLSVGFKSSLIKTVCYTVCTVQLWTQQLLRYDVGVLINLNVSSLINVNVREGLN